METTNKKNYLPTIWRTYLRYLAITFWFLVMMFAAYSGLFIHAFLGFASLTVLTYLTIKQADARLKYLKKKRLQQLSNYNAREDYMSVFSPDEDENLG